MFYPGWFLDFYGIPYIETEMAPFPFAVDLDNKVAAIPGTRNVPVVFTYTQDIAQVVAASMDLKTWPEDSYIIGDKMSFNELLAVAEEVRGALLFTRNSPRFLDHTFANRCLAPQGTSSLWSMIA